MGYNTPKQTVSQFQLKDRYARQYLSFAGKSSKDFLLYLSGPGVYDSPAADVESTSVPGRNGDILTENLRVFYQPDPSGQLQLWHWHGWPCFFVRGGEEPQLVLVQQFQ